MFSSVFSLPYIYIYTKKGVVEDNKDTPTVEKVVAGWGKALQLHTVFPRSDAVATIISIIVSLPVAKIGGRCQLYVM